MTTTPSNTNDRPCQTNLRIVKRLEVYDPPVTATVTPATQTVAKAPVYSIRDASERAQAARELASGKPALFYLGLYTLVKVLRPPWREGSGAEVFWQSKPDRPRWSKLPLLIRPQDSLRLVDFARVHPQFARFAAREHWESLWQVHGAPLHVIAPLREPLPFLHEAFRTTPQDLTEQARSNPLAADRALPCSTASLFWMEDTDWHDLALRVALHSPPRSFLGGTSFNDHGEHPPYTLEELRAYLARRDDIPFELIITDPWFESAGIHSSHTMVRLPLADESPELVMTRRGSVSPGFLQSVTGYHVRSLASTASASSQPGLSEAELERRLAAFSAERSARRMPR
jgi:hypothetical protein